MHFHRESSATLSFADPGDTILTLSNPNAPLGLPKCGGSKSKLEELSTPDSTSSRTATDDSTPPSATPSPVVFLASSHHLIQTSPVFKAALSGRWKEGSVTENGCYEISAEDWDTEAMRVVLSLIHNRTKDIPRTVSLEMLVKIAVLVDYYELHEALYFFTSLWMDALRPSVPAVYNEDIMSWICVSWVLKDASIFEAVTRLSISQSPGKIPTTTHLPVPEQVLSRINSRREEVLSQITASLHSVKYQLLDAWLGPGCSFECRCLLLGALVKYIHDDGVPERGVMKASKGRSLESIIERVRDMKSPKSTWHPSYPHCKDSLKSLIEPHLTKAEENIQGLGFDE